MVQAYECVEVKKTFQSLKENTNFPNMNDRSSSNSPSLVFQLLEIFESLLQYNFQQFLNIVGAFYVP